MILSNPFRPDIRVYKEARTLIKNGYEVTIICWDRAGDFPEKEIIDCIQILRVGPTFDGGGIGVFIIKLLHFWVNAFTIAVKIKPEIIHSHDFDTLPISFIISKFHGSKIIYDAHEIYSAMLGPDRGETILGQIIDRAEGFFMRRVDHTITINDKLAEHFRKRGAKVSVVSNCHPLKAQPWKSKSLRQKLNIENDFVILYIGVLEPDRFLVDAARVMASQNPEGIKLVIGGFGNLENSLIEISKESSSVKLIGHVAHALVAPYTTECDIVLCVFDPRHNLNNRLGSPNKLFDGVTAGKPVMVANGTDAARIVLEENCGVAIDYDPDEFMSTVRELKENRDAIRLMGMNARKAAEQRYNWEAVSKVLLNCYKFLDRTAENRSRRARL